jgi:hypothetical protein
MRCKVCETQVEHLNPCDSCITEMTHRLKNLRLTYLNPTLLNEMTELMCFFMKRKSCNTTECLLCNRNSLQQLIQLDHHTTLDIIQQICIDCQDNIIKRAILCYDNQTTIEFNIQTGVNCYVYKLLSNMK